MTQSMALLVQPAAHELERLRQTLRCPIPARSYEDFDLSDAVIGLRELGTRGVSPIRQLSNADDPMSQEVRIEFENGHWRIRDLTGLAGLRNDGVSTTEIVLTAGTEISLGGLTLIAESPRTISLRQYCARLLGWKDNDLISIDRAMRAIRSWMLRRTPLLLRGEGDMMLVAQALHRQLFGPNSPFIASDRRRHNLPATVRGPANIADGMTALQEANSGTLCVRERRLPAEFRSLMENFRRRENRARMTICVGRIEHSWILNNEMIAIPTLSSRSDEIDRIIDEYLQDAASVLDVHSVQVEPSDIQWIRRASAQSIPDIEKGAMRMTAIRASRTIKQASDMLGMSGVSLIRWLRRRARDSSGELIAMPDFGPEHYMPHALTLPQGDSDGKEQPEL
ncbi:MAG TPA: FHA domain-containing protein [Kofleriaceae bacterium]|nr:FHA domain-containing protein [Kofleriaceae bacterium]